LEGLSTNRCDLREPLLIKSVWLPSSACLSSSCIRRGGRRRDTVFRPFGLAIGAVAIAKPVVAKAPPLAIVILFIGLADNRTKHEHFARLHPIVRYRLLYMKLKLVVGNSSWWSVLAGMAFAGRAYRFVVVRDDKSKVKNQKHGYAAKMYLKPTSVSNGPRIALSYGHPR